MIWVLWEGLNDARDRLPNPAARAWPSELPGIKQQGLPASWKLALGMV